MVVWHWYFRQANVGVYCHSVSRLPDSLCLPSLGFLNIISLYSEADVEAFALIGFSDNRNQLD